MFQEKTVNVPARGSWTNLERGRRSFKALLLASVLALSLMGALMTSAQASDNATLLPLAISNIPPVLDPIGDKSVVEGSELSFTVTAADPDGDAVFLLALGLPSGASFDAATGEFSWTPLSGEAGSYSVTFFAADSVHYVSETITITVRSLNAPVIAPIGDKCVDEGSTLSFTVSASDPNGDAVVLSAIGIPAGASFDTDAGTGEFSWTPLSGEAGSYSVTFSATDGIESVSESVTITVGGTDRCPVLEQIGDYETLEGMLLEFAVQAIDPDGDAVTLSVTDLPDEASFDTGVAGSPAAGWFAWLPRYDQAGSYDITFTATSGSLPVSASETITITVEDVNRLPVLSPIGDKSVVEGSELSFTVTATDPDGDAVTLSVTDLPDGASFDAGTGEFSWTPLSGEAGSYSVTFSATDGIDSVSESITIVVESVSVNNPPVLDPIGDKSVVEGSELSFTVTAADPDGDAVTLSVTDLPDGASFDAGTGEFSWTPSYDQAGLYSVTFYASNSLSASETITITVTDVGPTEQIQNLVDAVTEYRASGDIDNHGIMNSLISKLDAAKSQLDSGNTKAAANILQAFINHLEAQKGKHITDAAAQSLIDEALIILGQLQGESVQVQEESTYNDDEDDDDDDVKTKKPKKTKKR